MTIIWKLAFGAILAGATPAAAAAQEWPQFAGTDGDGVPIIRHMGAGSVPHSAGLPAFTGTRGDDVPRFARGVPQDGSLSAGMPAWQGTDGDGRPVIAHTAPVVPDVPATRFAEARRR